MYSKYIHREAEKGTTFLLCAFWQTLVIFFHVGLHSDLVVKFELGVGNL